MPVQLFGTQLVSLSTLQSDHNIDFYIDTIEYHSNSNIKVFFQSEPMIIHKNMNGIDFIDYLNKNWSKYNFIFCYDPSLIQAPNVLPKIAAGTWIPPEIYTTIDISQKTFKISNLTGFKQLSVGHSHRHNLYLNQKSFLEFPITFFRSSALPMLVEITQNPVLPKDIAAKTILFESFQFSIVIENTREKNCFSEKIMDCLLTKTIPIYYGCENIEDFFDTTGWIILTDNDFLPTLYNKLQTLHEHYYQQYLPVVEKNYQKALQLANISVNYFNLLSKVLPVTMDAPVPFP